MPTRDQDRTSQRERSPMNDDDMVRGRSDDIDDMSHDGDEFEDTEDLDEEDEDEGNF